LVYSYTEDVHTPTTRPRAHRPAQRNDNPQLWPVLITTAIVSVGFALLPDQLREGPRWLVLSVAILLVAFGFATRRRGHHDAAAWISRALTVFLTLALISSVILLVSKLPELRTTGRNLLAIAIVLWSLNVLVFAIWYWEIDGDGPHYRNPSTYRWPDFAFPQFQLDPENASSYWMPGFVDYLYLAFNTSTAFSPTDTMITSKRAKLLMMSQSVISLLVIAILAARAISLF
jgi:uncharacterized membrane protein